MEKFLRIKRTQSSSSSPIGNKEKEATQQFKEINPTSVLSWNCNGLLLRMKNPEKSGWLEFVNYAQKYSPDIICLQEVRLLCEGCTGKRKGDTPEKNRRQLIHDNDSRTVMHNIETSLPNYTPVWSLCDIRYSGQLVLVKHDIKILSARFNHLWNLKSNNHHKEGRIILLEFQSYVILFTYTYNNGQTTESFARRRYWDNEFLTFATHFHQQCNQKSNSSENSITTLLTSSEDKDHNDNQYSSKVTSTTEIETDELMMTRNKLKLQNTSEILQNHEDEFSKTNNLKNFFKKETSQTCDFTMISEYSSTSSKPFLKPMEICPKKPLVWIGDLNCAPFDIDLSHPDWFLKQDVRTKRNLPLPEESRGQPGCTMGERIRFQNILESGHLIDTYRLMHPQTEIISDCNGPYYTWRGTPGTENPFAGRYFGKGMRIDFALVHESLRHRVASSEILGQHATRIGFCGSDHCPILLVLSAK